MTETSIVCFDNFGYLKSTFSEEELYPIKKEINEIIENNFLTGEKFNKNLAGNIEKEYVLIQSKSHIENLMMKFCAEYDKNFNFLSTINFLSKDVPFYLDNAWVNFQRKYEFNPTHVHSGVFSFVIWIDVPYSNEDERKNLSSIDSIANCPGNFEFLYITSLGIVNNYRIPVDKTYNNHMIFFPAKMLHLVYPFYTSDNFRISVSGNFKLKV